LSEQSGRKKRLRQRILWVYSVPTLLASVFCFIAFALYMRSFLLESAYTESKKTLVQLSESFEKTINSYVNPLRNFKEKYNDSAECKHQVELANFLQESYYR
jgi:hypothetical protein